MELNGESPGDAFGRLLSLSGDGTRLVVAGTGNDGNGENSGQVRVFHLNQTINSYTQVGMDIDGVAPGIYFGGSVSISNDGTTFIAGALFGGHARVFRYNNTTNMYTQIGPNINGEAFGDWFGWSVDISADGSVIAVGAIRNNGAGTNSGQVRVFALNSTGNGYVQVGSDINGGEEFEWFGYSVGLSANGTTMVVGAPTNNRTGRVRAYQFSTASNSYVQVGSDMNVTYPDLYFGREVSVSADGTLFIVSAPSNTLNGRQDGQIRVYQLNPTMNVYEPIGPGMNVDAPYGSSVSISADGTTFVLGDLATNNGRVRIYKIDPIIRRYVPFATDIFGIADGEAFGASVSISANGTMLAAGAPSNGAGVLYSYTGQVRVYNKTALTSPTLAPTKIPTKAPTVPSPILLPVNTPTNCGLFGFNWFCPRRGKCGLFRRLFRIHGC